MTSTDHAIRTASRRVPRRAAAATLAVAVSSWVLGVPTVASGQTQYRTVPRVIKQQGAEVVYQGQAPMAELAGLYFDSKWEGLAEATKVLVVTKLDLISDQDLRDNHYLISFSAKNPNSEPTLVHYLLHDPVPDQFSSRLPGIKTSPEADEGPLFEIFLALDRQDALVSTYTIESKPDEVLAQLPGFAKLIAPNVILPFLSADALVASAKTQEIWGTLASIKLTFDHADIKVVSQVGETAAPTDNSRKSRINAAAALADDLSVRQFVGLPCGQVLAAALAAEVATLIDKVNSPIAECRGDGSAGCWAKATAGLKKKYNSTFKATTTCTAGGLGPEDGVILAAAEAKFHAILATPSTKGPKAEFTVQNRPFKRFSFGVLNSWIAGDSVGGGRAKLDSGKYQSDELSGYLGMALVNFHPSAYDGEAPSPSWAERFRLYGGVAFTPTFGVGAGVGVGIVRGLVVNAGWTALIVNVLPADGKFGEAPTDPENPFERAWSHAFVVGISFNL